MRADRQILKWLATALVTLAPEAAFCGGKDYSFVALSTDVAMSTSAKQPIQIKLVDKGGNPVAGATITRVRLDMGPDGMAMHTAKAELSPAAVPGVYRLDAEYSMIGHWQLNVAAKVPGETETVVGKIILSVGR